MHTIQELAQIAACRRFGPEWGLALFAAHIVSQGANLPDVEPVFGAASMTATQRRYADNIVEELISVHVDEHANSNEFTRELMLELADHPTTALEDMYPHLTDTVRHMQRIAESIVCAQGDEMYYLTRTIFTAAKNCG